MSYTRHDVSRVEQCKGGYRQFLCDLHFPHCCDIRVCGAYGPPQVAGGGEYGHSHSNPQHLLTGAVAAQHDAGKRVGKHKTATVATFFVNGSMRVDRDSKADNQTVLVKLQDRPCLYFNVTYTPFYDCLQGCKRSLSTECQTMLHTTCATLCSGKENPKCATKHLFAVAHGHNSAQPVALPPKIILTLILFCIMSLNSIVW
mmetsp:Transcript_32698/g.76737  ORF Transcript_32698/g.76737 Transcript_32698/m.76737 type:complete len:201 (-) Transcript_32698:16-618(-)